MNWFLLIYVITTVYLCSCCYVFGKVDGRNEAFDLVEKEWKNEKRN